MQARGPVACVYVCVCLSMHMHAESLNFFLRVSTISKEWVLADTAEVEAEGKAEENLHSSSNWRRWGV